MVSLFKKKPAPPKAEPAKAADPPKAAPAPGPAPAPAPAAKPPAAPAPAPKPGAPAKPVKKKKPPHPLADAAGKALGLCLHPRVLGPALLPLVPVSGVALLLGDRFWTPAVLGVDEQLEQWAAYIGLLVRADTVNAEALRHVVAPLVLALLVAMLAPLLLALALLLLSVQAAPRIVGLVAARRFTGLDRRHGEAPFAGVTRALGDTFKTLLGLVLTLPLWIVPPFALLLPPLVCGWLMHRLLSCDVLADHATRDERQQVLLAQRPRLLGMGFACSYLLTVPSLLWIMGLIVPIFTPLLVLGVMGVCGLVFAFSVLWFAHFLLAALQAHRAQLAAQAAALAASQAAAPAVSQAATQAAVFAAAQAAMAAAQALAKSAGVPPPAPAAPPKSS